MQERNDTKRPQQFAQETQGMRAVNLKQSTDVAHFLAETRLRAKQSSRIPTPSSIRDH